MSLRQPRLALRAAAAAALLGPEGGAPLPVPPYHGYQSAPAAPPLACLAPLLQGGLLDLVVAGGDAQEQLAFADAACAAAARAERSPLVFPQLPAALMEAALFMASHGAAPAAALRLGASALRHHRRQLDALCGCKRPEPQAQGDPWGGRRAPTPTPEPCTCSYRRGLRRAADGGAPEAAWRELDVARALRHRRGRGGRLFFRRDCPCAVGGAWIWQQAVAGSCPKHGTLQHIALVRQPA